MRLVMMSDTHVPRRAADLPAPLWAAVDAADVVFHAGDWITAQLVERLASRAKCLVACFGNNDGPDVRALVPEVATVDLDGLRFVVVHETGAATGRDRRMAARFPGCDVLVFGHSHIPYDSVVHIPYDSVPYDSVPYDSVVERPACKPMRLLNPGSPTDRRRQPDHTYLTAAVVGGELRDVVLRRLPPRRPKPGGSHPDVLD